MGYEMPQNIGGYPQMPRSYDNSHMGVNAGVFHNDRNSGGRFNDRGSYSNQGTRSGAYMGFQNCDSILLEPVCRHMHECTWIFDDSMMRCKETKEIEAHHYWMSHGGSHAVEGSQNPPMWPGVRMGGMEPIQPQRPSMGMGGMFMGGFPMM